MKRIKILKNKLRTLLSFGIFWTNWLLRYPSYDFDVIDTQEHFWALGRRMTVLNFIKIVRTVFEMFEDFL